MGVESSRPVGGDAQAEDGQSGAAPWAVREVQGGGFESGAAGTSLPSARMQEHVDMDGPRADRQRRQAAGAASLRRMLQFAEAVEGLMIIAGTKEAWDE